MTEAAAAEKKTETKSVTWRMPVWVADEFKGDWSGFREILDEWADDPEEVDPHTPDDTTSVCMRMPLPTLKALEKEAKRLSKKTGRKWTAGKVARRIYEGKYEKAS